MAIGSSNHHDTGVDLSETAHTVCNLLTGLKLSGNLLLYDNNSKSIEQYVRDADATIDSAVSAIQHLTLMDKIQRNDLKPGFVRTDITKTILRTIDSRRYKWAASGVKLSLHGERIVRATDSFFLEMIVGELLDNACRYRSKDVNVSVATTGSNTRLIIVDDGEGIEEAEVPLVFDPYYRIAKHRIRGRRAGLGLTTVKAITNRLDGDIKLTSSPNWGTQVEVTI